MPALDPHDRHAEPAVHGHARVFGIGVALNAGFASVEAIAGWLGGSLSVLADAGHNLVDVLGLLLAWAGAWLATRRPTPYRTYGYARASILAALGSALLLLPATGVMVVEALSRLSQPVPVSGMTMMLVAGVGVLVNAGTAALFHAGSRGDLNLRGAYLHMAADAAVSLGVVLSGAAILAGGWMWLDPATSLLVAIAIVASGWSLLRESLDLAVDAVPRGIDPDAVERFLSGLPGVTQVHDLHIWGMSTTRAALTVHLVVPDPTHGDALLNSVQSGLQRQFGISHVTVQVERDEGTVDCIQADAERL